LKKAAKRKIDEKSVNQSKKLKTGVSSNISRAETGTWSPRPTLPTKPKSEMSLKELNKAMLREMGDLGREKSFQKIFLLVHIFLNVLDNLRRKCPLKTLLTFPASGHTVFFLSNGF
jgi:hypothetical protein